MKNRMASAVGDALKTWMLPAVGGFAFGLVPQMAAAQEEAKEQALEEIVVVGSQIKGASITEALAVTVVSADDIEVMGVDSGDELLQLIPENGQNFVN